VSAKHELRLLLGWSDIRTALSLDRLLAVGAISFGGDGGLDLFLSHFRIFLYRGFSLSSLFMLRPGRHDTTVFS